MLDAVCRLAGSIFGCSDRNKSRDGRARSPAHAYAAAGHAGSTAAAGARWHEPSHPRPRTARRAGHAQAEIDRLQDKLRAVQTDLQRESSYARRGGGQSNRGLVEALGRRAAQLEDRLRRLTGELSTTPTRPPSTPPTSDSVRRRPRRGAAKTPPVAAADRALADAARSALRRGKFKSASDRAQFEKVVSDLIEGKAEVQLPVLERLGEAGSLAALPVLRAAAHHERDALRIAALRGVLAMRHPATRDVLRGALTDPSHRVRVLAVRGLYGLDEAGLCELLCKQLRDSHPSVRRAAATYLGWRGFTEAERRLLPLLRDACPEVRLAVATALGQCGGDGAVFRLVQTLADAEQTVRQAAATSLVRLVDTAPEFDAAASDEQRSEAVRRIKAWWKVERVKRAVGPETAEPSAEPASPHAAPEPDAAPTVPEAVADATPSPSDAQPAPDVAGLGDEPEAGLDETPDDIFGSQDAGEAGTELAEAEAEDGLESVDDGFVLPGSDESEESPA